MKIVKQSELPVETSGLTSSGSFTIKQSPKAFQILSSGLYTNKPLAIIRELTCNAYDAHIFAGRSDVPVEIKLPTKLDSQFYVKDFGPGLTHDQVMHLYTTYFESTKTESNDFIGGLGLGSKSPFSYTDSFTVESRQGGVVRTYGAYVNDDGLPTIAQMSEQPTGEPDGLTVGFPVNPSDYTSFHREGLRFLRWLKPTPVVLGSTLPEYPEADIEYNNIKIFDEYPGHEEDDDDSSEYASGTGTWVRMGQVNYPVDWNAAQLTDDPFVALLHELGDELAIVIELPIGTVNVAASREGLQYDKPGRIEIAKMATNLAKDIVQHINSEVKRLKAMPATFERAARAQQLVRAYGFDLSCPEHVAALQKTSGIKLLKMDGLAVTPFQLKSFKTFTVNLERATEVDVRASGHLIHTGPLMVLEADSRSVVKATKELRQKITEPYYTNSRVRRYTYDSVITIIPNDSKVRATTEYKEELAAFLEEIGSPEVRKTSEWSAPPRATRGTRSSGSFGPPVGVLGYAFDGRRFSKSAGVYKFGNEAYYIPVTGSGGSALDSRDKPLNPYELRCIFDSLKTICKEQKLAFPMIAGMTRAQIAKIDDTSAIKPLSDYIDYLLTLPAYSKAGSQPLTAACPDADRYFSDFVSLLEELDMRKVEKLAPGFKELFAVLKTTNDPLARLIPAVGSLMGTAATTKVRILSTDKMIDSFEKSFPLLEQIGYVRDVTDEFANDIYDYLARKKASEFKVEWKDLAS